VNGKWIFILKERFWVKISHFVQKNITAWGRFTRKRFVPHLIARGDFALCALAVVRRHQRSFFKHWRFWGAGPPSLEKHSLIAHPAATKDLYACEHFVGVTKYNSLTQQQKYDELRDRNPSISVDVNGWSSLLVLSYSPIPYYYSVRWVA
jgi:hypothetical protein